jgi:hypothetical protein
LGWLALDCRWLALKSANWLRRKADHRGRLVIYTYIYTYIHITFWLFNIAMENGPFIDGLPITNGWIFPWLLVITRWYLSSEAMGRWLQVACRPRNREDRTCDSSRHHIPQGAPKVNQPAASASALYCWLWTWTWWCSAGSVHSCWPYQPIQSTLMCMYLSIFIPCFQTKPNFCYFWWANIYYVTTCQVVSQFLLDHRFLVA